MKTTKIILILRNQPNTYQLLVVPAKIVPMIIFIQQPKYTNIRTNIKKLNHINEENTFTLRYFLFLQLQSLLIQINQK